MASGGRADRLADNAATLHHAVDPLADSWEVLRVEALRLGFEAVGVASVASLASSRGRTMATRYRDWLRRGHHASMAFLERGLEPRENPSLILEGVASITVLAVSYRTVLGANDPRFVKTESGVVADYACGRDYHLWCRERLASLAALHRTLLPRERCRGVVDTAPLWERFWGREAGLGLVGRHTLLVVPPFGSRVFLASLLSTAAPPSAAPPADGADEAMCGACHRCVEACPTGALAAGSLDARRCLNYWTIEHRTEQDSCWPPEIAAVCGNRLLGCDTCQDVCPLNEANESACAVAATDRGIAPAEWASMTRDDFEQRYGDTPLARIGWNRLRNRRSQ